MPTSFEVVDSGVHCHLQIDSDNPQPIFCTQVQWQLEGRAHVETAEHNDLDAALEWLNQMLCQQVAVYREQLESASRRAETPFLQNSVYFVRDASQLAQIRTLNEKKARYRLFLLSTILAFRMVFRMLH